MGTRNRNITDRAKLAANLLTAATTPAVVALLASQADTNTSGEGMTPAAPLPLLDATAMAARGVDPALQAASAPDPDGQVLARLAKANQVTVRRVVAANTDLKPDTARYLMKWARLAGNNNDPEILTDVAAAFTPLDYLSELAAVDTRVLRSLTGTVMNSYRISNRYSRMVLGAVHAGPACVRDTFARAADVHIAGIRAPLLIHTVLHPQFGVNPLDLFDGVVMEDDEVFELFAQLWDALSSQPAGTWPEKLRNMSIDLLAQDETGKFRHTPTEGIARSRFFAIAKSVPDVEALIDAATPVAWEVLSYVATTQPDLLTDAQLVDIAEQAVLSGGPTAYASAGNLVSLVHTGVGSYRSLGSYRPAKATLRLPAHVRNQVIRSRQWGSVDGAAYMCTPGLELDDSSVLHLLRDGAPELTMSWVSAIMEPAPRLDLFQALLADPGSAFNAHEPGKVMSASDAFALLYTAGAWTASGILDSDDPNSAEILEQGASFVADRAVSHHGYPRDTTMTWAGFLAERFAAGFGDNAEAWNSAMSMSLDWAGSIPELVDTIRDMLGVADEVVPPPCEEASQLALFA